MLTELTGGIVTDDAAVAKEKHLRMLFQSAALRPGFKGSENVNVSRVRNPFQQSRGAPYPAGLKAVSADRRQAFPRRSLPPQYYSGYMQE